MVKVRAGQSDHIHQQLLEFFISKIFFNFFFFDSALEWESRPCGTNGWMSRILFILFRRGKKMKSQISFCVAVYQLLDICHHQVGPSAQVKQAAQSRTRVDD